MYIACESPKKTQIKMRGSTRTTINVLNLFDVKPFNERDKMFMTEMMLSITEKKINKLFIALIIKPLYNRFEFLKLYKNDEKNFFLVPVLTALIKSTIAKKKILLINPPRIIIKILSELANTKGVILNPSLLMTHEEREVPNKTSII